MPEKKKIILLHHSRNERKLYNCEKKKEENNFNLKGENAVLFVSSFFNSVNVSNVLLMI